MNLKNAAIFLFAGAIVGLFGDFLNYFERILELDIDLQGWGFILISLSVNVAFLLVGKAFYSRSATLQTRRSAGIFLTVTAAFWVLYYFWVLAERFVDGVVTKMAYDYYLWMFFIMVHSVTSLVLGIAIASAHPARIRIAALLACIGAGTWTAWLLFRLLTNVDYFLRTEEPLNAVKMLLDFTLPVSLFFFGMALHRSPGRGANAGVIDEF